jgi:hypothetical protein
MGYDMNHNERKPGESFELYKLRRANQNYETKHKPRTAKVLWDSSRRGTYIRAKHGALN